tara:strand:+ start:431 stop:2626 length:2196 start_codon:yes stop_codon:yes gene_type:complete
MSDRGGLEAFSFKHHYDHVRGDEMLETFYVPMLERSLTYDRVAGYFSSAVLSHASAGFAKFCSTPNPREEAGLPKFRLIVGARLNPKDEQVVLHAENPELLEEIETNLLTSIDNINLDDDFEAFEKNRWQGLSWMLQTGILEIKVGAMCDPDKKELLPHNEAEFHSKFGIVSDGESKLYFSGSTNETKRAWLDNYETIDVSRSWAGLDSQEKIETYEEKFESLWNNERVQQGVVVVDFPKAAELKILDKFRPADPSGIDEVSAAKKRRKYIDEDIFGKSKDWNKSYEDINKWRHQEEAVNWFVNDANGVGIFQMATGSGKTWTSMKCMKKMLENNTIEKVVVAVPNSILPQWREEVLDFLKLTSSGGSVRTLSEFSGDKKEHFKFKGANPGAFLLVSHSMLLRFLNVSRNWDMSRTLLVIDELHHMGADRFTALQNKQLEEFSGNIQEQVALENEQLALSNFGFRLGLSATPWSKYDDENSTRNRFLVSNFTRKDKFEEDFFHGDWEKGLRDKGFVFYFGLEDGIKRGILCEFDYFPLEYEPTEKEKEEYRKKMRGAFAKDDSGKVSPLAAIRASAVFKGSREKLPIFFDWLKSHEVLDRSLMFVEDTSFGKELMNQLNSAGYPTFASFFQGDPFENLESFAQGKTHFLVSCHRISEGLDIKSVSQIVLFSSSGAPLETIQRIGRALRKGEGAKRALVVDFIYDNPDSTTNPDAARRDWLEEISQSRNESR